MNGIFNARKWSGLFVAGVDPKQYKSPCHVMLVTRPLCTRTAVLPAFGLSQRVAMCFRSNRTRRHVYHSGLQKSRLSNDHRPPEDLPLSSGPSVIVVDIQNTDTRWWCGSTQSSLPASRSVSRQNGKHLVVCVQCGHARRGRPSQGVQWWMNVWAHVVRSTTRRLGSDSWRFSILPFVHRWHCHFHPRVKLLARSFPARRVLSVPTARQPESCTVPFCLAHHLQNIVLFGRED